MQFPEDYMLPCLNKELFGMECMGCGLQRSIALLFQGHFAEAFQMYPAIYTLLLLFGVIAVHTFRNFKHAYKIIVTLGVLNVIIIIINFILKTF